MGEPVNSGALDYCPALSPDGSILFFTSSRVPEGDPDPATLDELEALRMRPGLSADSPSMRSVGYRQLWAYLDGSCDLDTAIARGQAATRQLAKRQITWLRSEAGLTVFDPLEKSAPGAISRKVAAKLNK